MVIQHAGGGPFSVAGWILLLCGIGAAYSLDRIVDGRPRSSRLGTALLVSFTLCCTGICWILAARQPQPLLVVLGLAALSSLYPLLKKIPLAKTLVVAFSWVWACSTLPGSGSDTDWLFLDVTPALFLLISSGSILCDLKDLDADRKQRIPSLPVLLGSRGASVVASGLAVLAAAIAFGGHHWSLAIGAVLIAIVARFPFLLSHNPQGPILVDSILTLPGILIASGAV
jgi:4-hydroxybenzoate polyprenyltransferase